MCDECWFWPFVKMKKHSVWNPDGSSKLFFYYIKSMALSKYRRFWDGNMVLLGRVLLKDDSSLTKDKLSRLICFEYALLLEKATNNWFCHHLFGKQNERNFLLKLTLKATHNVQNVLSVFVIIVSHHIYKKTVVKVVLPKKTTIWKKKELKSANDVSSK